MELKQIVKEKIDNKTKPPGSLGLLEETAAKIAMIQQTESPVLKDPAILVFAGDHGLTKHNISPFPQEVTMQMVMNFLSGGAAINVFCRQNDMNLKVIDAGVNFDFGNIEGLIDAKIAFGTNDSLNGFAMTEDQCADAISRGRGLVAQEFSSGCNVIGFGEMGIGNTSSAALLMSKYLDISPDESTGRGTGLDDEGLSHKKKILAAILEKHDAVSTPLGILAALGGFEIAMMSGAMIEAAGKRMVILIDGFITTAALLAAESMHPGIVENCIFSHTSEENGHKQLLTHFHAKPLLNLRLRLGEGTGAALCYPLVKSSVAFLEEMASFASANISNRDENV